MRRATTVLFILCCSVCAYCQPQSSQSVVNISINISQSVPAVNYLTNSSTRIDFTGTALMPFAVGTAKVESGYGLSTVDARFSNMSPASQFGPEFLTYVLWAITPEGRASNLGEVRLKGQKGDLRITTPLPNFALIVTAEPYFAISAPSEMVVLRNTPREDTKGAVTSVTATLLSRGTYNGAALNAFTLDSAVPLAVYEARNAMRIAQVEGADKLAPDAWARACNTSAQMEDYLARKQKDPTITAARNAVQQAEDARSIALRLASQQRITAARQAAAEQLALQQKQAAQQQAELTAEREAALESGAQSMALANQEDQARLVAEAAQKRAQMAAEQSAAAAAEAKQEQQRLRTRLLAQLNSVLQTVDTPRGLVTTMADVQFAPGQYRLSPETCLALAELSGVIIEHPGLKLEVDGYTDNTGGESSNLSLSAQRADAVRAFLVHQGLRPEFVTSAGMGSANPVADNDTAAGRQKNRRVEIIISGEAIGRRAGE